MSLSIVRYHLSFGIVLLVSFSSCVALVKDPGKSRESEPMSLGSGVIYNPSKSVGLSGAVDLTSFYESRAIAIRSGAKGSDALSLNGTANDVDIRHMYSRKMAADFMTMYFPWERSSFFMGMHSRFSQYRRAYSEWTNTYEDTATTTNIEWDDQELTAGGIVGMNLRWVDGSTITFGTSVGKVVYSNRRFIDDGDRGNVDLNKRSETISSFDSYNNMFRPMYCAMYTYSFRP
ncbi:MAG: hypothetical protein NT027_08975 [Proteobacteria bacterium]|nr:hypothetical protein [Pseudomonadota bacterium]